MKHLLLLGLMTGLAVFANAQKGYEIASDSDGTKMLKGVISSDLLERDTAFSWFHINQAGYTPSTETVSILRAKGSAIKFVVFGGTWCGDTQNLWPKFFALMTAAGIGDDQVLLVAVDRHKKSLNDLPETMHLKSTPTFIVLKQDAEVGRVVEYGPDGQWERELGEIARTKF
jgi:thiol-disulfide isomerase/thioredoxin